MGDDAAPDKGESGSQASPGGALAAKAAEQQQRFRDAAERIRSRADLTAKALGGLGTTVLTAIGIAKVGDLFPARPSDVSWWLGALWVLAGFALLALVIGFFTRRFWRLTEPIFLSSDERRMPDLDKYSEKGETPEHDRVVGVYDDMARLNEVPSLRAYEARGHRLERIAEHEPAEARRELLIERASLIKAEVAATQTRALAILVRERTTRAIMDRRAAAAFFAFVLGILMFALGTDWLESKRVDEVALAKSCADARTAGATVLPNECDSFAVTAGSGAGDGDEDEDGDDDGDGDGEPGPGPTPPGSTLTERSRGIVDAMRAASVLASTLKLAADQGRLGSEAGQEILRDFLTEVGFPLGKGAIERVADTLWRRYVDPGGEPVEALRLESSLLSNTRIVVIVRNRNQPPIVRVVPIRKHR